jgi:hypothetical protein
LEKFRYTALFFALLAALASDSKAQLKKSSNTNPPSTQSASPPAPDQRGTDKMPLSVKITPREPSKEQAEKEEAERLEKAAVDKKVAFETQRVADYTWWLAFLTLFVVMTAIGQAGLFVWQLGYMKKGMKDATIAARAASRSAIATVAQAKIARDTLTKVQRPYVFAFGIQFLEQGIHEGEAFVTYTVANYGETPATIDDVKIGFWFGDPDLALINANEDHSLVVEPIIAPKERRDKLRADFPQGMLGGDVTVFMDNVGEPTGKVGAHPKLEYGDWFCRIMISYHGVFSRDHVTSACWRYSHLNSHFVKFGGEEYNYNR